VASAKQSAVVASFRMPTIDPIHSFAEPLELISQQNFRVELNFPRPQVYEKSFKVWVILHGYFHRGL